MAKDCNHGLLSLWLAALYQFKRKATKSLVWPLKKKQPSRPNFLDEAASNLFFNAFKAAYSICMGENALRTDSFRLPKECTNCSASSSSFCASVNWCLGSTHTRTLSFRVAFNQKREEADAEKEYLVLDVGTRTIALCLHEEDEEEGTKELSPKSSVQKFRSGVSSTRFCSSSSSFSEEDALYQTAPSTLHGSPLFASCSSSYETSPVALIYSQSESVVVYSNDPLSDFVCSMRDMLAVVDTKHFHSLLQCYLQPNEPSNHDLITLAFLKATMAR